MHAQVYIAKSLDGFIATSDGGLDWLFETPNPDQIDYGWSEFIAGIDALLMGRKTFEKVLTFGEWPYEKPVFVLSNSLTGVPAELGGKAEIVNGDLPDILDRFESRGYINLYIDGGQTIQNFLKEDLIDEMVITTIPILLGGGIPLFGELNDALRFRHTKTEVLSDALVKSHYTRDR